MENEMENIMNKISETTKAIQVAKEAYSNALKEAVDPTLKHIAEHYGEQLQIITLIAFVPGFNDGEPCEHSTDWGVGYSWLRNYGMEYFMDDWFEDREEQEKLLEKDVVVPAEVKTFIGQVLEPFFEEKLDTNYRVHIIFENGTYRIEEDEYDCGY
jgi:2-hydroxy-3-keto-5-methylthiopentenyl-1-phosphate phosphatase